MTSTTLFNRIAKASASVALILSAPLAADATADGIPICKPAAPSIEVSFTADAPVNDGQSLIIWYDEAGSEPYSSETFSRSVRTRFSMTQGNVCIGERARYEVRPEGQGMQSIQIRLSGNGNPIIGGVEWHGPSHPHKVWIDCDATQKDLRQACRIVSILDRPELGSTDARTVPDHVSRHDQCEPGERLKIT